MLLDTSNNTTKQTYRYSRFMDGTNLSNMNDSNMQDKSYGKLFDKSYYNKLQDNINKKKEENNK